MENEKGTQELIDEMGLFFKGFGVPRAAGQMIGYLMACDPPEQSAAEIAAAIDVSPASISSNMRLLMQFGAIEPKSRRGDRKAYYRLRRDSWSEMIRSELMAFQDLDRIGQRIKEGGGLAREDGINDMIAWAEFWQRELPDLMARWKQTREER